VKHIKYEIISLIHSKSYDQVFDQSYDQVYYQIYWEIEKQVRQRIWLVGGRFEIQSQIRRG
jgi:hypothetical protein